MVPIYRLEKGQELPERVASREALDEREVRETVRGIIEDVRAHGDAAIGAYTKAYDKADIAPEDLRVNGDEVNAAYRKVSVSVVAAMRRAVENIRAFHEKQRKLTWMDVQKRTALGQLNIPIQNVGIYVPGGTAPLFSTVMMTALPAMAAGVERIVMVTPPREDGSVAPELLIAAYECGVKEIYKVGGVQAIAALAYGTQTIQAVDKIVGPGNVYVTQAKKEVFGTVGIDMTAGPSEVLIVADFSARADWIAADMIAQAEHDARSSAYLITDREDIAEKVAEELDRQLADLPRENLARKSLETNGAIMVVSDMLTAMEFSNKIAPEHLELNVDNPFGLLGFVRNAGACFLGHFSPEPLGDYYAGPNHVLPTSGTARFFSTLSVDDFVKKTSVIRYSKTALLGCAQDVILLARAEGLEGHARSVQIRSEEEAGTK